MKKKICVLLAVIMLLCALSACKSSVDETAQPDVTAQPNDTSETSPAQNQPAEAKSNETTGDAESNVELHDADFYRSSFGDGTCEVTGCRVEVNLNVDVIVVPETLFGDKVIGVGVSAFACSNAKKIVLPDTVEYIGSYAFQGCSELEEVQFGTGLKRIGGSLFNMSEKLKTVTFPEGMTTIEDYCTGLNESLTEMYIPASVTEAPKGITYPDTCPNLVVVTPAGSYAEEVCIRDGMPVRNP